MTKQEQIEEMTKIIQHEEEIYPCEDDVIVRIAFALYKNTAEKLYNAGYRKIRETNETLEEQIAKSYVNDYCREVVEIDKIDEMIKELTK